MMRTSIGIIIRMFALPASARRRSFLELTTLSNSSLNSWVATLAGVSMSLPDIKTSTPVARGRAGPTQHKTGKNSRQNGTAASFTLTSLLVNAVSSAAWNPAANCRRPNANLGCRIYQRLFHLFGINRPTSSRRHNVAVVITGVWACWFSAS